jgi:glycosyltransferase involved in cell wall biosynthesis
VKILLSAYACHPTAGSESRLGWQWAQQLAARGHEVWVIARRVNQTEIEQAIAAAGGAAKVNFLYHDCQALMPWLRLLKARFRYFYYYVWQWGAYQVARQAHAEQTFDLVHHVTWVQFRAPSFMGRLGIPFIFGPVAGGEATPWPLRGVLGSRQWLVDLLRDVWTLLARFDPMVRRTYREATRINVATPETLARLPAFARAKAHIQQAIAYEPIAQQTPDCIPRPHRSGLSLLYVGRFLGLKGMALGLTAFAGLLQRYPDATLTLVGCGPAGRAWRKSAGVLGIEKQLRWVDWLPVAEVEELYGSHDALLFPSLHDSGGMVVLEAMARGLPVVCLALGGPGLIVDNTCGLKIDVEGRSRSDVEMALIQALEQLARDPHLIARLRTGAKQKARLMSWNNLIAGTYGHNLLINPKTTTF